MVEINNQRKAFLDMLAWSEGTDNGRQKTRKSWLWRHCRRRELTDYSDHPRKLVTLNPKLKSTGADATSFFPLVGCHCKQFTWKTSLRKVRTLWHCSRLRSVALYLWLIVVISVRQSTVAAISGLHCRALVMVSSSIRLTAWLQKIQRSGAERSERLMYEQSHRDYLRSVICIIVCLSWAVNWLDNAITYKAQRDKNARELKLANAAITDMQMRQRDVAALDGKYTKELADAKAENDALRDDVAAGRHLLHIALWPVSHAKPPPPPAWIMQPPRLADTAERDYFTLRESADHYAKTTGRNPEVY